MSPLATWEPRFSWEILTLVLPSPAWHLATLNSEKIWPCPPLWRSRVNMGPTTSTVWEGSEVEVLLSLAFPAVYTHIASTPSAQSTWTRNMSFSAGAVLPSLPHLQSLLLHPPDSWGRVMKELRKSSFLCMKPGFGAHYFVVTLGFPSGASDKESTCQCRKCKRYGFNPWVRKIPWRWKWQPTPVFLPGESHGQEKPVGLQSMGWQKVGHEWVP